MGIGEVINSYSSIYLIENNINFYIDISLIYKATTSEYMVVGKLYLNVFFIFKSQYIYISFIC